MRPTVWTAQLDETLRSLWAAGLSSGIIGERLSISSSAVTGRANRLGLPRRASPIPGVEEQRAELAELMAEGCPSVSEAARRLGITQQRADQHWQRIKRDLGVQAYG